MNELFDSLFYYYGLYFFTHDTIPASKCDTCSTGTLNMFHVTKLTARLFHDGMAVKIIYPRVFLL